MRAVVLGRVCSALAALFLVFDGTIKLLDVDPVRDAFDRLGWPPYAALGIGLLELGCTALYLVPRTARHGAILLTGYLGGAVATHVRVLDPWLTHTLFPVWIGALLWIGLVLRDRCTRELWRVGPG